MEQISEEPAGDMMHGNGDERWEGEMTRQSPLTGREAFLFRRLFFVLRLLALASWCCSVPSLLLREGLQRATAEHREVAAPLPPGARLSSRSRHAAKQSKSYAASAWAPTPATCRAARGREGRQRYQLISWPVAPTPLHFPPDSSIENKPWR